MSNPDNEKTRLIRRPSSSVPQAPPPPVAPSPASGGYHDPEETRYVDPGAGAPHGDETRIIEKRGLEPGAPAAAPAPYQADEKTVLVRPSSSGKPSSAAPASAGEVQPTDDFGPEGPVVGWVVVVKGPGRGKSLTLGYGMNPIGREAGGNRVCLPFGDEEISRKKHAVLTYDPRGRKFYLQHGESTNLTYLGDSPVLAPTLLEGGETIRIGRETELRFVPLCGEGFDWGSGE